MAARKRTFQKDWAEMRADYDMNKSSRFVRKRVGVASRGSNADYHFRNETTYYSGIEQARDMDRNDAVIGILADRRVDNIVQGGFKLDPKTGDAGLDLEIWNEFTAYANDPDRCDIAGEMTWNDHERAICRAESIDGDIVAVGTEEGSFQLIEAHLIQTKSKVEDTFLGVQTNKEGKRLKYFVLEEKDQFGTFGEQGDIDVRDEKGVRQLFHIYNPKRVMQTRGVTALAPIFSYAGMLEDINFAKLVQQQVVSCFAIFRERSGLPTNLPKAPGYGAAGTEQTSTNETRLTDGVSPGMEVIGALGEKLHGFSPNIPNSEYFMQVKLILQLLGVNFGLPLCLVLMDGSETNFSGWRGAVDEARKGFVADQLNLVRRFHRPAFEWWLYKQVEDEQPWTRSEIVKAKYEDRSLFRHNWNLPTWSYIEPVADAEGDAVQLRNALTSPRRLHSARGSDWEEVSEEIIADNLYAIERAAAKASEINAKFPNMPPMTWRDLISLPMPEGQTISLQDPNLVNAKSAEAKGVTTNA